MTARPRDGWAPLVVRGVLLPTGVLATAGALGGVVWAWWSEPASFAVARGRTYMDEAQLGMLFGVEARYGVVGLIGGFVVALGLAPVLRRTGWVLVLGVLLGAAVAAAVSYAVGVQLGPQAPEDAAAGPAPGDLLAAPYVVETYGLFCSWAVGALAGIVVAVGLADRTESHPEESGLADLSRG